MKRHTLLAAFGLTSLALGLPFGATGQSADAQDGDAAAAARVPVTAGRAIQFDHTDLMLPDLAKMLPAPTRQGTEYEVPNQLGTAKNMPRSDLERDPLAGPVNEASSPQPGLSFNGPSSDDTFALFGFRLQPPDTNGDVGRQHIVMYVNVVWRMFDKAGNPIGGAMPGNSFWAGFGGPCQNENTGDPIAIYDHLAARWVFSQFAPFDGIQCFAISDGENPMGPYTRYAFLVEPEAFNDYPKLGVWASQDGTQSAYTYTGRNFIPQSNPAIARDITAMLFDRDAILAGNPNAGFVSAVMPGGFGTWDGAQPGDIDNVGAAPGGKCPLFSVAAAPSSYRFFEFCENFPGAGTFTTLPSLTVPSFDDNLGDVPQPGGDSVDTLAYFTMYRASHRVINGNHLLAMSHTVDAGSDRAGMRWAILDVNNYNAISIVDTGTHAPADGFERWMGAVTLDTQGNLGMGYTRGGNGQFTSVYYTGRETTDPAGQLQAEVQCVAGTGSQTGGGGRWGDYSSTSIDPSDGCTFWTAQEFVQQTGSWEWNTRVCSFSFPSCGGGGPDFDLSEGEPGIAGQVNVWTTTGGAPDRVEALYFGQAGGTTPVTLGPCSTTMDLGNARVIAKAAADGSGSALLRFNVRDNLAGRTANFQALDVARCVKSDVQPTTFE
jgi:hypothetical protein